MLAKLANEIPVGEGWHYEPKWDGFRALVFRDGDDVYIQSRDSKPLNRYFPELEKTLLRGLPERIAVDGEIIIAGGANDGLDFEALLLRIHPAASRVAMLAAQSPASFVAWDLLALGDRDLRAQPFGQRRAALTEALASAAAPVYLTPATTDAALAQAWFTQFEGAGLDGIVAKRLSDHYQPGVRVMVKVKHARTADCVVGGFRWHKNGPGTMVGSLLLGLYDDANVLHHVGIASGFSTAMRLALAAELAPLRHDAGREHPWSRWRGHPDDGAGAGADEVAGASVTAGGAAAAAEVIGGHEPAQRKPGASSRWNRAKDLSWEQLRIERVCEVAYDHLQGTRFRHATHFLHWRPDKSPTQCRYDQLETHAPFALARILSPSPK